MAGMFADLTRALALLPSVPTVMTSAFESKRSGILVDRVMLCADDPPCVAVAVPKGHRIATLVRDSHSFCLNLVDPKHRLLIKKFENGSEADAFELLEHRSLATGSPCLGRAVACLDCDVMRHFDLESDHEIYIGQVMAAWVPANRAASCTSNGQAGTAMHVGVGVVGAA
jgi:flavin reductase (DIM6/NTAB) family NADH-FMN oxidoreductase RutF